MEELKVGDKVLINCGDKDDGSLGNGDTGVIKSIDGYYYPYGVLRESGIYSWYERSELTLQKE